MQSVGCTVASASSKPRFFGVRLLGLRQCYTHWLLEARQLAVSGVSFLLTMVFLGLQVADSARKGALSSRSVFAGFKYALSSRTGSRRPSGLASPSASVVIQGSPSASVVVPPPVKPVDISVEVSHPSPEASKPSGESDADDMRVPSAPDEMSTTVRRSSAFV